MHVHRRTTSARDRRSGQRMHFVGKKRIFVGKEKCIMGPGPPHQRRDVLVPPGSGPSDSRSGPEPGTRLDRSASEASWPWCLH